MTCLRLDENLKKAALILRSITDLFYIMDIIIQLHRSDCDKCSGLINKFRQRRGCCSKFQFIWKYFLTTIAKTIWWSYILIDMLAILPLPQVLILHFFSKMRGSRSLNTRKFIMNSFVLMQYVPRVFRIYQLCKEPKKSVHEESTAIWVKGVLNLFMYILASHVLGAVWYFLAVQRMTICWQYACRNENKCDTSTFSCYDHGSLINITFMNDICPIDPPNAKLFDFGIFLSLFQSGIPRSTSFLQKFSNCFCWGLRNLSSLGSNLQPSTNTWENFFVAFVSIMGLLLFIYLIGNLQTYMQLETTRIESHRHKMKIKRKIQEIGPEIELWLSKSGLPKNPKDKIKPQIMEKVQQVLAENKNAGLDHIISILPSELRRYIESFSPWNRLKQELVLQTMDEEVLKVIREHLKPMKYTKNNVIIQENEPLEMMLIIVEGHLSIEKRDYASNTQRGPTELYGEKLLTWPSSSFFPGKLPTAAESARAIDDVEALVLMADDMKSVGIKFRSQFTDFAKFKGRLSIHLETSTPALRIYTAEELKKATNNYHESGIVGAGSSATIHKGILPNHETAVAIKKFKKFSESSYTHQDVIDEIVLNSRLNHKNVVRLLGCCLESEVPSMVFEFIPNGTLAEHVYDKSKGSTVTLPLELRMKIAAETAGALAYLHSLTMPIIHRDVKTTSILLDENYRAKLIDFGISRVLTSMDKTHISTNVKGSFGYLDPEYYRRQELTPKSDVYSFGVVLGELLTSRKAINREEPCKRIAVLAELLKSSVEKGLLDQILDQQIVNGENIETAKKVADLAYRCLRDSGVSRPSMKEVATELEGLVGVIANNQINFP
ncbi:putative protein kinase RLK-Pelle-WAK family [Rosa chinensis]|uniref:Protein kinase domain-containing protein n=2 Tax=Rosa chinensis TaxID=74649 RepID=A0A2P6SLF3_ROSCH|nr:cyclic nucleotide-gated ion channel 1 isoform X2 [Rosa chinensis]PRQ59496.1 putative protein kinase RLK-Pelle-WAK family [Rosa chinensis]